MKNFFIKNNGDFGMIYCDLCRVVTVLYILIFVGSLANRIFDDMNSEKLPLVPDVKIDPRGDFKYILVRVTDEHCAPVECKFAVRGTASADYHDDIFQALINEIKMLDLRTECLGGGRINHNASDKSIIIYGTSVGYGKAEHDITMRMIKDNYKDYNVTVQDD